MVEQFLRGQVIRILDDQRLIINLGSDHGIQVGDRFYIYETGEEITDPQTGESLGQLELVKGEVEVVHAQEKLSFVMPLEKQEQSVKTVLSATLQNIEPTGRIGTISNREHLNIKHEQVTGPIQSKPIAIGDPVRSSLPVSSKTD